MIPTVETFDRWYKFSRIGGTCALHSSRGQCRNAMEKPDHDAAPTHHCCRTTENMVPHAQILGAAPSSENQAKFGGQGTTCPIRLHASEIAAASVYMPRLAKRVHESGWHPLPEGRSRQ